MTEREALLRAVCEFPDDETPRLVFADWLQEHGEEARAEFIRLQCRLALVPKAFHSSEDVAREQALLKAHAESWLEPIAEFVKADVLSPARNAQFRRGFVERLETTAEVMHAHGEHLFALAPVRELHFEDEVSYAPLAQCKWLARLRALRLSVNASEDFVVSPLVKSRHLANLKVLTLRSDTSPFLDRRQVRALVAAKALRNLEELDLGGNVFNDWNEGAFEELVPRANFPALRILNLNNTALYDPQAVLLAATPWIAQLRELHISLNEIRETGLRAILESPHLTNIEYLDMSCGVQRVDYFEPDHPLFDVKRLLVERFGSRVCFTPY